MEKDLFVTITGTNYYYGMKPFEIGRIIRLVKEPGNEHDPEAIRAELPFIDKIGYLGNSPQTVARGTISAGRLYDQIGDIAYAQVLFVTATKVICLVLEPEEVEGAADSDEAKAEMESEEEEFTADKPVSKGRTNKMKHGIGFRI